MTQPVSRSFHHATESTSFIDGEFISGAKGHALPVINPANEDELGVLLEAEAAEVDGAVMAARKAFEKGTWRRFSVARRQEVLHRIHDLVLEHADELAYLEVLNTGIPINQVRNGHLPRTAYNFSFFADYISQSKGEVYTQTPNFITTVTREPIGVAAIIAPWNAPLGLATMQVAAAISFGNSCVLKPSEFTPLAFIRLMELLDEAGVPPGVVNLINGRGGVTGQALVEHSEVDVVSFTGGTQTGSIIGATAGRGLKKVMMELGGKSANIICQSADLERAIDGSLLGIYSNNGQMCLAGSRILVQKTIADEFIAKFIERSKNIRIGDPLDERTELGPAISAAHRDRVLSFVDLAEREGCELLVGGATPDDFDRGFYVQPTAVKAPSNDIQLCQEEIFGPFASFLTFDTLDDAFRIANQTKFGLVSYIWTNELHTMTRAMQDLQAGCVWVNTPMMRELRAPFGGYKMSGVGRTGGHSAEELYTEEKTTSIPIAPLTLPKLGMD